MNKRKIILDLCGGTGSWSAPYRENGYDVRVITLPEYDLLERTILDRNTSGGGYYVLEERRNAGNGKSPGGLRHTRRPDLYYVLACEDYRKNAPRLNGGYGARVPLSRNHLVMQRARGLGAPILGVGKPGRTPPTIYRTTAAHVRPVRLRGYIHKENGFVGILQRPSQKPPRAHRRGAGAVQDKQADFAATPRGLHTPRGVERSSRPPFYDEQAFCRGFLSGE